MVVVGDVSCTFELGMCGWVGNWSHALSGDGIHVTYLLSHSVMFCYKTHIFRST